MILSEDEYTYMTDTIRKKYGDTIRGVRVLDMNDNQIFAIFKHMKDSELKIGRKLFRNKAAEKIDRKRTEDKQITISDWLKTMEAANV